MLGQSGVAPPANVPQWHSDYFESKLLKKQPMQETYGEEISQVKGALPVSGGRRMALGFFFFSFPFQGNTCSM